MRKDIEEIKREFNERNYELLEDRYVNAHIKLKYKCLKHPDSIMMINYNNFKSGHGCKKCGREKISSKQKLLLYDVNKEFEKKGLRLLEKTYINAKTKLRFECPIHQDFEQKITYDSLMHGGGCKKCSINRARENMKYSFEYVQKQFEKHGYTLLDETYLNSHSKLRYKCNTHPDKELFTTYNRLQQGNGCPYCSQRIRPSYEEVKSEFEYRGYILVSKNYTNSKSLLKFRCLKHSTEEMRISYDKFKQGGGCKYCSYEILGDKRKMDIEKVREYFESKNYSLITTEYYNSHQKLEYRCNLHYDLIQKISLSNLKFNSGGCTLCNSPSKAEDQIIEILYDLGISFQKQYRIKECKNIKPLPFDFAIFINEQIVCLIEYDGIQHFKPIEYFGGEVAFKETKKRDNIKSEYCQLNNIPLIRIPYWEYADIEYILLNILSYFQLIDSHNVDNELVNKLFVSHADWLHRNGIKQIS